jgi:hypothetical protein
VFRRLGMVGVFLSLGRVLPDRYSASGVVAMCVAEERRFGRCAVTASSSRCSFRSRQTCAFIARHPQCKRRPSQFVAVFGDLGHYRQPPSDGRVGLDRGKVSGAYAGVAAEQRGTAVEVRHDVGGLAADVTDLLRISYRGPASPISGVLVRSRQVESARSIWLEQLPAQVSPRRVSATNGRGG